MWEKIRVVFTIPELRQKIFLTLLFLAIYRVGWQIPLPFVNVEEMSQRIGGAAGAFGQLLDKVALFSASDLSKATIFGLGIMPYISASIIFQLLGSVWKPLEELKKEGESGQKKINEYTRYATVVICIIQSWGYMALIENLGVINKDFLVDGSNSLMLHYKMLAVLTMTCGTVFLMWLGEQIDEYGIGNGISLLIMAGIVARMPGAANMFFKDLDFAIGSGKGSYNVITLIVLVTLFISVVFGVVLITLGQRRIPTQSAKHVRGRRTYGGSRAFLPLKVNQAGVMPIIFAQSLILIPSAIFGALGGWYPTFGLWSTMRNMFSDGSSFMYNGMYVALIYFFCYFWTAITFNPKEMSDNLKNYGTFIPGYRPGKRTTEYLEKVMSRITYVGAGFLALVAIIPTIVASGMNIPFQIAGFYGGTGLLIAVSVAFDLVQKIDSHLVMRNYRGLLEKN